MKIGLGLESDAEGTILDVKNPRITRFIGTGGG